MEAKEEDVEYPLHFDGLFRSTMKEKWNEVVRAYKSYPSARKAKLTTSEDTALHIAVSSYHADPKELIELAEWVRKLVDTFPEDQAVEILGMPNDKGNTPLHLAAAVGSVDICECIALKDHRLLGKRNDKNETPCFLAATHGKLEVFLCLQEVWEKDASAEPDDSLFRRSDGWNILHAAIAGEHLELAYHIILKYQRLIDGKDEKGCSPLHLLAMNPSLFYSCSKLQLCDRIIYRCLLVSKLKLKDLGPESHKNKYFPRIDKECPDNCETCMNLMRMSREIFKAVVGPIGKKNGGGNDKDHRKDEESQGSFAESLPDAGGNNAGRSLENRILPDEYQGEDKYEGSFPRNYTTCINLFKFAINLMLIILGIGFSRIRRVRAEKEKHTWAKQIMDKLIEHEKGYKYDYNGQSRGENLKPQYAEIFAPPPDMPFESDDRDPRPDIPFESDERDPRPDITFESDERDNPYAEENNKSKTNEESDEDKPVEEDRCVVVAAKMKESQTKEKLHSALPDTIQELDPQPSFVLLRYQKRKAPNIKKETPILIAAKMGITEMVDKILDTFPVAIQDVDEHEKNALLLAIENRQIIVYDLLMEQKLPDFVLYQVDDEGNSAWHLAATFQEHMPLQIPAALRMQWEIKWFNHVKQTMPSQYLVRYLENNEGETAGQIFTRTHERLVKDGTDWLIKTSESCSVVAALVASVASPASTSVPGGRNDDTGDPPLKGQLASDIFSIASLVALCSSVAALVFFLGILASRRQEQDFGDLPQKLALGLSSLFTAMAAMLLSFCSGNFFVLKDELHNAAFFIYAVTCFPMTFYAFAQLPLYLDLLWSITRKIPLRSDKVFSQ